ncbi:leucine-rich repeat domain-containing protein [Noviherbaspirillum soli]|uniref:hypothetical protein n=1 Tax=Noviherbaspirillum soli TaxID=1064518 RepID=UPI00188BE29C|nr:hypothetical protein [Noviherbaspirillum soli]
MDSSGIALKRTHEVNADDVGVNEASPKVGQVKRRRTDEAGQARLPVLTSLHPDGADAPGPLMAVPMELLGEIVGWLTEEHLSCLVRTSRPIYSAVQRLQLALPASYREGGLPLQAKQQRVMTSVNLQERQALDWRDCLERLRGEYVAPAQSRGLISDYARGLGERYRHVSVLLDEPGLSQIAAGLLASNGWRHLEMVACTSASAQIACFLHLIVAGLKSQQPAERRQLSLHIGAALEPVVVEKLTATLSTLLASDTPMDVTGLQIKALMVQPLAQFLRANPCLQRLSLDLRDDTTGDCASRVLSLLEGCAAQPGGLILQGLGAGMDYARLAALLLARPSIKSLSLAGKIPEETPGCPLLASLLHPGSLAKLGLSQLTLRAEHLASLAPVLAAQAGLHTLKFRCCAFPDGIDPLTRGLAANRSIVRMELVDCTIAGNAGNSTVQGEVLKAFRHNAVIRQLKIGYRDLQSFQAEMAELRRDSPQLKVIRYSPFRAGVSATPHS